MYFPKATEFDPLTKNEVMAVRNHLASYFKGCKSYSKTWVTVIRDGRPAHYAYINLGVADYPEDVVPAEVKAEIDTWVEGLKAAGWDVYLNPHYIFLEVATIDIEKTVKTLLEINASRRSDPSSDENFVLCS